MWGFTVFALGKTFNNFKKPEEKDLKQVEVYNRLLSIFHKNKYGFHTRIMSDFDLLLEAVLNEKFIDDSSAYYDDPIHQKEIEDMETGLNGDMNESDIKHLMKDKDGGHHEAKSCMRYPGRFGTNMDPSDDLSCYKILPKGQKPLV
jgi:hypothetical protein